MSDRSARVISVLLALGIVSIVPVGLWSETQPSTVSLSHLYLGTALTLVAPLALLGMWLLLHLLVRDKGPDEAARNRIRLAIWTMGPVGCAWAVFYLTNPSLQRQPQGPPRTSRREWRHTERILGFWVGSLFLALEVVIVALIPQLSSFQYTIARGLVAAGVGGLVLSLEGFLNIRCAWVRATAAALALVLAYLLDPVRLVTDRPDPRSPAPVSSNHRRGVAPPETLAAMVLCPGDR
jgi:hypothetical protein